MSVAPPPARTRWAHDVFGNSVCYLEWDEATVTTELLVVSKLDIDHFPAVSELPIDPIAEQYPFSYASDEAPDLARTLERQFPDPDRLVDAWAHGFLSETGPTRTFDMLVAMTKAIKADFTYEGRNEEGTNPPLVTLDTKKGACRDFALLMIEAVRSLGLAARFVTGYLYDEALAESDEPVVGGGATHAWVAVYLPGAGWVEFDPTNGLVAGRNLIRVALARMPEQAVPMTGGFVGEDDAFAGLSVSVDVAVGDGPAALAA